MSLRWTSAHPALLLSRRTVSFTCQRATRIDNFYFIKGTFVLTLGYISTNKHRGLSDINPLLLNTCNKYREQTEGDWRWSCRGDKVLAKSSSSPCLQPGGSSMKTDGEGQVFCLSQNRGNSTTGLLDDARVRT